MENRYFYCAVCGRKCEPAEDKYGRTYKIRFCTKACAKEYWRKLHRQWQSEKTKKTGAWGGAYEQNRRMQ